MEETDPFLNTNPFAELGDDDDDNPSNDSTASNPAPQPPPLTANELEQEAEREHLFHDLQQICKSIKDKSVKKAIKGAVDNASKYAAALNARPLPMAVAHLITIHCANRI